MGTISRDTTAVERGVEFRGKYLSVTSFRRDGTAVATPVWFVEKDGVLLAERDADSYKVRRIRVDPQVLVAPCGATGKLRAEQVKAHAKILGPEALEPTRKLMGRKYRMDRILILPIYRLVQRLQHKPTDRGGKPVIVEITPEA